MSKKRKKHSVPITKTALEWVAIVQALSFGVATPAANTCVRLIVQAIERDPRRSVFTIYFSKGLATAISRAENVVHLNAGIAKTSDV